MANKKVDTKSLFAVLNMTDGEDEPTIDLRNVKISVEFILKPLSEGDFNETQTKEYLNGIAGVIDTALVEGINTEDFMLLKGGKITATLI
jgi:hypothetical protein